MYTTAPVCLSLPPPNFNGSGPMNGQYFNHWYPQPYGTPFFANCDPNVFRNTPPPGFGRPNGQASNQSHGQGLLPPYGSKPIQFTQPPPGYSPVPVNIPPPYPPFNSQTSLPPPPMPFSCPPSFPPVFPNYTGYPPPNNQFSHPPPTYRPVPAQTPRPNHSSGNKFQPTGPSRFCRNDRKFQPKVSTKNIIVST